MALGVQFATGHHALDHGGLDRAGTDGIDTHPALPVLEGSALGLADHAVLGGVVSGPAVPPTRSPRMEA